MQHPPEVPKSDLLLDRKTFLKRAAALSLLPALLSSCGGASGETSSKKNLTLTLDWYPNADHAGIFLAKSKGFFRDAGLGVNIRQPSDPASVLQLVAAGRSQFGVSYEPEITSAAAKNIPVISVMAIVQHPLNSIISLKKANITSPADLAGKRVGYAGQSFGSAVIDTVLRKAGKDPSSVQKVNVGYDLRSALTSGKVDAIVDAYWNIEAVELADKGFKTNVIRLENVGVPNYDELVIATSKDYAKSNPKIVRSFVDALVKGHAAAMKDQRAAVEALLRANRELDPETVRKTVALTVPLFKDKGEPIGYQNPDEWRAYVKWAAQNRVLPHPVNVEGVMTNKYLPERS